MQQIDRSNRQTGSKIQLHQTLTTGSRDRWNSYRGRRGRITFMELVLTATSRNALRKPCRAGGTEFS